jgi:hypothetical protein
VKADSVVSRVVSDLAVGLIVILSVSGSYSPIYNGKHTVS